MSRPKFRFVVSGFVLAVFAVAVPKSVSAQGGGVEKIPARVVATVNGDPISEAEFFDRVQRVRGQDFILSVNPLQVRPENAGLMTMNSLINEHLILQWAAKTKDLPTEAEVNEEFTVLKQQDAFRLALEKNPELEAQAKREIRINYARFNIATAAVTLTPKEAEEYYKKNVANYTVPEKVKLAAIRTAKVEAVPKVQADLKAGKPFTDLVKTYSDEPNSKAKNGELGEFNLNDRQFPQAFREALKGMKIGQISGPIKLEFAQGVGKPNAVVWFFLRLTGKTDAVVRPFSEVKRQVERTALLERAGGIQAADKKILEYRETASITISLPAYAALANTAKKK